jgi:hypothetical protein
MVYIESCGGYEKLEETVSGKKMQLCKKKQPFWDTDVQKMEDIPWKREQRKLRSGLNQPISKMFVDS